MDNKQQGPPHVAAGIPHEETGPQQSNAQQSNPQEVQGQGRRAEGEVQVRAQHNQGTGLFHDGRPKHALQGVGQGLANAATGVAVGLVGLVAATVAGSREEGVLGGVKGLGAGLVGLAGLTAYGAYTGVRQAARGVCNTPEAVSEAAKGELLWDSTAQQWVKVDLPRDCDALPTTDDDIKAKARTYYHDGVAKDKAAQGENPRDAPAPPSKEDAAAAAYPGTNAKGEVTDFYAFLGVPETATTGEIKKAFTRRALVMHPDKNPNDPNATTRFQQLMQVYNVLSNEVTRTEYDRNGCVDENNVHTDDTNPIEEVLGLNFLEPLVGKLRFVAYFETNTLYDTPMLNELHRRRRLRIARTLCGYLDNTEKGFDSAALVMRDAVATRAGPQMVTFVAESYATAARQQLHGSSWEREMDSWYSSKVSSVSTLLGLAASGARTAYKAVLGDVGEEDILGLLVAANESDVRRTVLQACRLALYDSSVSVEARAFRAQRLEMLSGLAMEEVRKEVESRSAAAAALPPQKAAPQPGDQPESAY